MTDGPSDAAAEASGQQAQLMDATTVQTCERTHVVYTEIRIKGEALSVPPVEIHGRTVITIGKWLRMAAVRHEDLAEGRTVADTASFISCLRESGLKADLFTSPPHQELGTAGSSRRYVASLTRVVRQWKAFWHYSKRRSINKERVRNIHVDSSLFIGAYHEGKLIGCMKTTLVSGTATMTQIFRAKQHPGKRPNNALIVNSVKICESQRTSHLVTKALCITIP